MFVALEMMPVDGNVLGCGSSFLSKEVGSRFFPLTIIDRASDPEVSCTVTWDSSVHNEACLNKPTLGGDRIYLILKVFLHLSMPGFTAQLLVVFFGPTKTFTRQKHPRQKCPSQKRPSQKRPKYAVKSAPIKDHRGLGAGQNSLF